MARSARHLAVGLLALPLAGCAAPRGEAAFTVPRGAYPLAFDAAREVLVDHDFALERIDAARGVITSEPKGSAGIFTPWHREQQTFTQEIRDAVHRDSRIVRVTFEPAEEGARAGDLRRTDAPLLARVSVAVERLYVPGREIETESIRRRSVTVDPALVARGMQPNHSVMIRRDDRFAVRLARQLERRLAARLAAADPTPPIEE